MRDVKVFGTHWSSERAFLRELSEQYSIAGAAFVVKEVTASGAEELLSPEALRKRLKFWREIELETQMHIDLENGFISSPPEFVPHDEDWTR